MLYSFIGRYSKHSTDLFNFYKYMLCVRDKSVNTLHTLTHTLEMENRMVCTVTLFCILLNPTAVCDGVFLCYLSERLSSHFSPREIRPWFSSDLPGTSWVLTLICLTSHDVVPGFSPWPRTHFLPRFVFLVASFSQGFKGHVSLTTPRQLGTPCWVLALMTFCFLVLSIGLSSRSLKFEVSQTQFCSVGSVFAVQYSVSPGSVSEYVKLSEARHACLHPSEAAHQYMFAVDFQNCPGRP